MDYDEFVIAVRHRLGLPVHPLGTQCHNVNNSKNQPGQHNPDPTETDNPKQCGMVLDSEGVHANLCEVGPTRYRPHTAVAGAIQMVAKEARTELAAEVVVPHLHQTKVNDEWIFTSSLAPTQRLNPEYERREARLDPQVWHSRWPMES